MGIKFAAAFLLLSSAALAAECPIHTELNPKIQVLTNRVLLKINPKWPEPEQSSGVTITDFSDLKPWEVEKCDSGFCVKPKASTLFHTVYIRPEKLGRKVNPRWNLIAEFPCAVSQQKNFVTYVCTLEHEKVHVVQRDDAIQEACPQFVEELEKIKAPSVAAAEKEAQAALNRLKQSVFAYDTETAPYKIEWSCNEKLAEEANVSCSERPEWKEFPFLSDLERDEGKSGVLFTKNGERKFTALFAGDATRLESAGAFEGCAKKQWFFTANKLDQENCFKNDGKVTKKFYLLGKLQREIDVSKEAKKLREKIYFDPKERLRHD